MLSVFRDGFGFPVIDISSTTVESLGASLAMCVPSGGSNVELMSPAVTGAPLAQSLQGFLDRRGPGLFAMMLEADDPDRAADALAARGLQVLPLMSGATGRDIHPRSAHGVLVRVYPTGSFGERIPEGSRSLGISGIVRVRIVVTDLDRAVATFTAGFGLDAGPRSRNAGVRTATVHTPSGAAIELVGDPDDSTPLGSLVATQLASRGEGLFALVHQAGDLGAVERSLSARGLPSTTVDGTLTLDPASVFGARIMIESG